MTPLLVQEIVDRVTTGRGLASLVLILVGVFLAEALLSAVQSYLLGRTGETVVLHLRRSMVGRLIRWPIATHDRHRTGDLLSRVGADTGAVRTAMANSLSEIVSGTIVAAGSLVIMAVLDPILLALTLGCLLVAVVAIGLVSVRIMIVTMTAQRSLGAVVAGLERALRAVRTVKLSQAEDREDTALRRDLDATYDAGVRQAKLESLLLPATAIAVQGALVLVLAVGGARLATGDLEAGTLIAFLLYLFTLVVPMTGLFAAFTDLQAGRAAFHRVRQVLDEPGDETATPPRRPAGSCTPDTPAVTMAGVSFGYPGREPVLQELSLQLPEFSCTALVGPSGAGKSTVLALLSTLYVPTAGTVELFGRDLGSMGVSESRTLVGYVEQDSPVMAGTVLDNLTYAAPHSTSDDIDRVLELTNLTGFVSRLPDGLRTEVGDGGALLSGGERQRIAVARMLLKHPRLLMLDESTSQMDPENERLLVRTIAGLRAECTTLVVAHRLSTVQDADRIVVLDRGRIVAAGRHTELLRESPLYVHMVRAQFITADA
ncbi:ABC transporter ATP-binding protein [Pseudonocardia sp. HH130630-07]|uniref:ABC transporter ATP-binding protein n=1 Tax=Pseudonocardia sp. HH130630-07 TaxID=1690815 RepID=UPI000A88CF28|nr:ABC transporter ATP-binding protein [Pseudonocardia sp. HH130630-07]